MTTPRLQQIKKEIEAIKRELATIGAMRPGVVNQQYRDRHNQRGVYYQLSYSHRGQSHTKHVRLGELSQVIQQTATYKRLRELVERWVDLAIEECELRTKESRRLEKE